MERTISNSGAHCTGTFQWRYIVWQWHKKAVTPEKKKKWKNINVCADFFRSLSIAMYMFRSLLSCGECGRMTWSEIGLNRLVLCYYAPFTASLHFFVLCCLSELIGRIDQAGFSSPSPGGWMLVAGNNAHLKKRRSKMSITLKRFRYGI